MENVFDEIKDWVSGQGLDIEMLVDVSGSMKQERRIADAMEFAKAAAKVAAQVDEDGGIGLTFFADHPGNQVYEDVKEHELAAKFDTARIGGTTDTMKFIRDEVNQHYDRKKDKADQRTLIVCITDGEPAGGKAEQVELKKYLAEIQAKVDWTQRVPELKVLFYQVGTDAGAKAFLQDLDDDNATCGLIVETAFDGKDQRTVAEIFRDALKEHIQN